MYWTDGSIYKGNWYKGIQWGYGIMQFSNGEIKEGYFENGAFKFEGTKEEIERYMRQNKINLDWVIEE